MYAYGGFPHLVGFWQVLQEYGGDAMWAVVMEVFKQKDMEYRAAGYAPKHWFSWVQEQIERIPEPLYRAAAIFYLNRRSFSGTTESGGCSSTPSRFLYTNINTLRRWPRGGLPGLTVDLADFRESLARHPDIPAYLDPPYLVDSALYGKRGDKHKGFNHGALARILKTRPRWMLSYNDCPEVRELYKDFDIIVPDQWNHSMSKHKKTSEVIILNP